MKQIIIAIIFALVVSPLALPGQAASAVADKDFSANYDAFVRKALEKFPEIPGASIVVIKDDKPLFLRAFGMANKEAGIKADSDTLYYIASSTKAFLSLTAALLDKEGKIKLDDPVTKHFPGLTFKASIPDKVTIRNLLTHTSGLRNSPMVFRMAYSGQIDEKEIERAFTEGTTYDEQRYGKYAYDNLGYNIYGLMLRRNLGKKWQDLLHERIFKPLAMNRTTAYMSKARAAKWPVAEPYLFSGDTGAVIRSPLVKLDNSMQSAGGMITTASDIGRWLRLNMNVGKLDGKQIFPVDIMKGLHAGYTPHTRNEGLFVGPTEYGLGWQIGKYRSEKVIYHHGGYSGWNNHFSFMPEQRIGVAVMVNESTAGQRIGDMIAAYAYDLLLGRENREAAYAAQLDEFAAGYAKAKEGVVNSVRSRASRVSQLTRPLADYTGMYRNDVLGNIRISTDKNTLRVNMGNIDALSTPFTEKDTIRVEMLPGEGEIVRFDMSAAGTVDSLTYRGMKFTKFSGQNRER